MHLNYALLDGYHNGDGCHHSSPRDGRVKKRYKDKEGSVHVLQTNKILKLAEADMPCDMHSQSNITGDLAWIDDGGGDDDIIDMDEEDGGENISHQ